MSAKKLDVETAKLLKASDPHYWTTRRLAANFGVSDHSIRWNLDPEYRKRQEDKRKTDHPNMNRQYTESHKGHNEEMLRQREMMPEDTRDFTARYLGDPIPGDPRRELLQRNR
jgi:hypothetical protein